MQQKCSVITGIIKCEYTGTWLTHLVRLESILPMACILIGIDEPCCTDHTQRRWCRKRDRVPYTLEAILLAVTVWPTMPLWSTGIGMSNVRKSCGRRSYLKIQFIVFFYNLYLYWRHILKYVWIDSMWSKYGEACLQRPPLGQVNHGNYRQVVFEGR